MGGELTGGGGATLGGGAKPLPRPVPAIQVVSCCDVQIDEQVVPAHVERDNQRIADYVFPGDVIEMEIRINGNTFQTIQYTVDKCADGNWVPYCANLSFGIDEPIPDDQLTPPDPVVLGDGGSSGDVSATNP